MVVQTWDEHTIVYDEKRTQKTPFYEQFYGGPQQKVSYHYNQDVSKFHFGVKHPMKPFRLMLTDHLVLGYGLHDLMDLYEPRRATKEEILDFHSEDYIDFLQKVTPENLKNYDIELLKRDFNIGDDCPIFDGMYDYSTIYSGTTMDASRKLLNNQSDIAINWSGGLHHAKKHSASGFCYVNDIVMAILNFLRFHARVLYIDIDIHHGDGVEEAFYTTDRVMTLSFHKYNGEYFPGTGNYDEIGAESGKHYSLNVPLKDGIDDDQYVRLFKSVVEPVMSAYQPGAVVLQCGADSLGCDRLGCFSLNTTAHGECVRFVKTFQKPLLVLGGGGYTPRNVSRAWAYETSVCLGVEMDPRLPAQMPFIKYFAPDYSLHPTLSGKSDNKNTRKHLEYVKMRVIEQLRYLNGAPSVQFQQIPPDLEGHSNDTDQAMKEAHEDRNKDEHL